MSKKQNKNWPNLLLCILSIIFVLGFHTQTACAAETKEASAVPTYNVSGHTRLVSNFVDRGLTFSNASPTVNTDFLLNLGPQFKIGLWGASVSQLSSQNENFWIKIIAETTIQFSPAVKSVIYVHDDHFFSSDNRNGQRLGLTLDYDNKFIGLVEFQNNFEGTKAYANYFQLKYNYKINEKLGVENSVGYTIQKSTSYTNYFDLAATGYWKAFAAGKFELGATYNSSSSQFGDRSKMGYFIGLTISY